MTFQEFLNGAFSPVNTVLSVLLVLSVIYWIFTILTGLDIDVGIHSDLDPGADAPDGHFHAPDHDPSAWMHFLKFLNLDIVPVTYFMTLSLLITWLGSFYLNYFVPMPVWMGVLAIFPLLVAGILLTRLILKPLNPFFREINHKGERAHDFLGREGRLKSGIQDNKIGMMEVFIGSDPMTLMVKSKDGKKLEHGTKVMIVDEEPEKRIYYVQKSMWS
ncbi:YqiJ family protein [Chryseobacterium gallinarum]|uniref:YqiJ family protein n=1 Tax=Chryseobacterium gallinarum TaxID=1324352 RepID=A0ABX6KT99_CHRGL|nr:YqiJ family protein [Chryseobacterium gallinarum]QIY91795.1 YqiJ family protein [Chryseobacterium gallinarum]